MAGVGRSGKPYFLLAPWILIRTMGDIISKACGRTKSPSRLFVAAYPHARAWG